MPSRGFFSAVPQIVDDTLIVDVPHFNGLFDLHEQVRRATGLSGVRPARYGNTPTGFYAKCDSAQAAQSLWDGMQEGLLAKGHLQTLTYHRALVREFREALPDKLRELNYPFADVGPEDPRFGLDAPVVPDP